MVHFSCFCFGRARFGIQISQERVSAKLLQVRECELLVAAPVMAVWLAKRRHSHGDVVRRAIRSVVKRRADIVAHVA
jgi:hypothetical protein